MITLYPADVLVYKNLNEDWFSKIKKWAVGEYDHVSMYLGAGFDGVPLIFESTPEQGSIIRDIKASSGRFVTVLRPKISPEVKRNLVLKSIDIASESYLYDYISMLRSIIPRILNRKFGLNIPVKYMRDSFYICSESISEIYWSENIEVLPKEIVPLPQDFLYSDIFEIPGEGILYKEVR